MSTSSEQAADNTETWAWHDYNQHDSSWGRGWGYWYSQPERDYESWGGWKHWGSGPGWGWGNGGSHTWSSGYQQSKPPWASTLARPSTAPTPQHPSRPAAQQHRKWQTPKWKAKRKEMKRLYVRSRNKSKQPRKLSRSSSANCRKLTTRSTCAFSAAWKPNNTFQI